MKWETQAIKNIYEGLYDGPHATPPVSNEGAIFLGISNITEDGRLDLSDIKYISEDDFPRWTKRVLPCGGDIVFSYEATLNRYAIIPDGFHGCLGRRMALIRPNNEKALGKYLYYYFFSEQWRKTIAENTVMGATVDRIPLIKFPDFPISLPDLNTQRKIADILSIYDDLVENNQKQVKLLEEAAQRLYKEWFVDLRFPGHENVPIHDGIPEGWEKNCAESFFEITIGKTPPRAEKQWFVEGNEGTPWVSISDMGNSGTYVFDTAEGLTIEAIQKHSVKVVPKGTILLSFKLTVGRVSIATTNMCTNEAIAHFMVNDLQRSYTYLYLKTFEYDKLGNTSAISKAVNSKIIKAMPFVMPDAETLSAFSQIASPLLGEIYTKQAQNRMLIEARDRLLPKLMSGEIEV